MHVIEARNVNDALIQGMIDIEEYAQKRESRNGPVLVMPEPVTTRYSHPTERVLFNAARDANPFFHFFEGLHMIAGCNDVASLAHYVKRMETFSDDGVTLHGAYGYRWRHHFGHDQLPTIIDNLITNPEDRRNVLQMWDSRVDLGRNGKDVPCNTQIYFTRDYQGKLDMTVCCRSNDMIWGAYGANVVHMSMLQEYMAAGIGCEVGIYYQISNNFHAYCDSYKPLKRGMGDLNQIKSCMYGLEMASPYPMVTIPIEQWDQELKMFMDEGLVLGFKDPFFRCVANPILQAHYAYKNMDGPERYTRAVEILKGCFATDWRIACQDWLKRRQVKAYVKARAEDDGVLYE